MSLAPKDDETKLPKPKAIPPKIRYPFWFGGSAASFAACVTHPLDLGPPPDTLSAALLRQLTYSTTRFGVYETLKQRRTQTQTTDPTTTTTTTSPPPLSLPTLILLSSTSGFLGGLAGNPADVLNVRMQADFTLPEAQRRNYAHALDGLVRMIRDEGPLSLAKGVWPNSIRAALMTASQLSSYDTFKRLCLERLGMTDNTLTHFCASTAAGFVATTICSPVDVIKTRIMSATPEQGKRGIVALLQEITRHEGVSWCFRGWVPSFVRLGPQTVFTMIFFEQHKKLYRRWKGVD
ncbi:MAG: hypothetical protein Q9160_003347 [Pyrenula sp. 1 TL-2023]